MQAVSVCPLEGAQEISGHRMGYLSHNEVFSYGGSILPPGTQQRRTFTSQIMMMNLLTKKCTVTLGRPDPKHGSPEGRQFHTMTELESGRRWIVVGGWAQMGFEVGRHDEMWELSWKDQGFQWRKLNCKGDQFFTTIWLHSCVWDPECPGLWVVGGLVDSAHIASLNLIERRQDQWVWKKVQVSEKKGSFTPRFGQSALMYKERQIVIFGGLLHDEPHHSSPFDSQKHCSNEVFFLNTSSLKNYKVDLTKSKCSGAIPPGRYSHGSCIHGDKMYIFSGLSLGYSIVDSNLYCLDLGTLIWRQVSLSPPIPGRARMGSVSTQDDVYFFGGQRGSHLTDFYRLPLKRAFLLRHLHANKNFLDCQIICQDQEETPSSKKRGRIEDFEPRKKRKHF